MVGVPDSSGSAVRGFILGNAWMNPALWPPDLPGRRKDAGKDIRAKVADKG